MMLVDLVFDAVLTLFDLFHPDTQAVHLFDQVVDRASNRVGQVAVFEFGHVLPCTFALNDLAGYTDDGRIRGRRRHHDRPRANAAAAADSHWADNRRAGADHHMVFEDLAGYTDDGRIRGRRRHHDRPRANAAAAADSHWADNRRAGADHHMVF